MCETLCHWQAFRKRFEQKLVLLHGVVLHTWQVNVLQDVEALRGRLTESYMFTVSLHTSKPPEPSIIS